MADTDSEKNNKAKDHQYQRKLDTRHRYKSHVTDHSSHTDHDYQNNGKALQSVDIMNTMLHYEFMISR